MRWSENDHVQVDKQLGLPVAACKRSSLANATSVGYWHIHFSLGIPVKLNAHSERKPNGIPG
jgi:hypothetical protein